jgi:hypothetical protein
MITHVGVVCDNSQEDMRIRLVDSDMPRLPLQNLHHMERL